MFNYVVTGVLVLIIVVWSIRFLNQAGLAMPNIRIFNWITAEPKTYTGETVDKKQIAKVFCGLWAYG